MAERLKVQFALAVGMIIFSLNLAVWSKTLLDPTATTEVLAQLFPNIWTGMDPVQPIQWAWYVRWTLYLLAGMVSTAIGILSSSITWTALQFLTHIKKPASRIVKAI